MDRVQESQEFLSSTLKAQGYSVNNVGTRYADQVPSTGKTYILRMSSIPCFSPYNCKMLPAQLMEGLRVEFRLEASVVAFCPNVLASVISELYVGMIIEKKGVIQYFLKGYRADYSHISLLQRLNQACSSTRLYLLIIPEFLCTLLL